MSSTKFIENQIKPLTTFTDFCTCLEQKSKTTKSAITHR